MNSCHTDAGLLLCGPTGCDHRPFTHDLHSMSSLKRLQPSQDARMYMPCLHCFPRITLWYVNHIMSTDIV